VVVRLTVARSIAELNAYETSSTSEAFTDSVARRRLGDESLGGSDVGGTSVRAEVEVEIGGRSRSTGRETRRLAVESTANWVADPDWKVEFARRLAVAIGVSPAFVTLASAVSIGTAETRLTFEVRPEGDLSASDLQATVSGLGGTSFFTSMLGVSVTGIEVYITDSSAPSSVAPPPAPPDEGSNIDTDSALLPSTVVAITVPIVLLFIAAVAYYLYRQRKKKRLQAVTVQPRRELVEPPPMPPALPPPSESSAGTLPAP